MLRYLARARRPRPRARPHDDPARLVHDEAQRDHRDGADHLARVRPHPSVRAGRAGRRLPRADRRPRALAGRDHRLRRGVAAAERRLAGRVRGPARDPPLPRVARRDRARRVPDSRRRRTARTRRRRRWPACGSSSSRATTTATSTSTTSKAKVARARRPARGVDGHVPVDARRVRGAASATSARVVHDHGGQVYLDGANLNALVGCRAARASSAPTCRTSTCTRRSASRTAAAVRASARSACARTSRRSCRTIRCDADAGPGRAAVAISAAPWGSAGILPISWAYIAMMGAEGLRRATQVAILNANYLARRLAPHYPGALHRRERARRARVHHRPAPDHAATRA